MKKTIALLTLSLLLWPSLPALAADTNRPEVGTPSPEQATVGVPVNITATVSDTQSGIASCNLYVDNNDVGAMTVTSTTASKSYTFFETGIHTMFVFCRDNANNFQSGPNASVSVTQQSGSSDNTPPNVSQVSPETGTVGEAIMLSVSVSDSGTGVSACNLLVDGFSQGGMDVAFGAASKSHTFPKAGSYEVYVQCFDGAGNGATGNPLTFVALEPSPVPNPVPAPKLNPTPRLIKLDCFTPTTPDDPCRAVYYHGEDNKRHAFPNSKVFFSWYADFSTVQVVSPEAMSGIALGKQVTYRPGYTLVKFTSLNNVYAVSRGGVLRWVTSEPAANALYGSGWNKIVHDIPDTFFLDYTFGADINVPADYSPSEELGNTLTIDANM